MKKIIAAGLAGLTSLAVLSGCSSVPETTATADAVSYNPMDNPEFSNARIAELQEATGFDDIAVSQVPNRPEYLDFTVRMDIPELPVVYKAFDGGICTEVDLPEVPDHFWLDDVTIHSTGLNHAGELELRADGADPRLLCLFEGEYDGRPDLAAIDEDWDALMETFTDNSAWSGALIRYSVNAGDFSE